MENKIPATFLFISFNKIEGFTYFISYQFIISIILLYHVL